MQATSLDALAQTQDSLGRVLDALAPIQDAWDHILDALDPIQDGQSQILGVQGSIQGGRDQTQDAMDPHTADLTTSALGLGIVEATVVNNHHGSHQVGPARWTGQGQDLSPRSTRGQKTSAGCCTLLVLAILVAIQDTWPQIAACQDYVETGNVGLCPRSSRDRPAGICSDRGLQKNFSDRARTPSDLDPHKHQADHASLHLRIRGDQVRIEGNRPARVLATSAVKRVIGKMLVPIPLRSRDMAGLEGTDRRCF